MASFHRCWVNKHNGIKSIESHTSFVYHLSHESHIFFIGYTTRHTFVYKYILYLHIVIWICIRMPSFEHNRWNFYGKPHTPVDSFHIVFDAFDCLYQRADEVFSSPFYFSTEYMKREYCQWLSSYDRIRLSISLICWQFVFICVYAFLLYTVINTNSHVIHKALFLCNKMFNNNNNSENVENCKMNTNNNKRGYLKAEIKHDEIDWW